MKNDSKDDLTLSEIRACRVQAEKQILEVLQSLANDTGRTPVSVEVSTVDVHTLTEVEPKLLLGAVEIQFQRI